MDIDKPGKRPKLVRLSDRRPAPPPASEEERALRRLHDHIESVRRTAHTGLENTQKIFSALEDIGRTLEFQTRLLIRLSAHVRGTELASEVQEALADTAPEEGEGWFPGPGSDG